MSKCSTEACADLIRLKRKSYKPTVNVVSHDHPIMAYWAVPGVKQAGANFQGERVMRLYSHCHKGLKFLWDERALTRKYNIRLINMYKKKEEKNIYH